VFFPIEVEVPRERPFTYPRVYMSCQRFLFRELQEVVLIEAIYGGTVSCEREEKGKEHDSGEGRSE
jgi:hypothetical protein